MTTTTYTEYAMVQRDTGTIYGVCGTPRGSTPDPETIARVKASH